VAEPIFCYNQYTNFTVEKIAAQIWATSVIFEKLTHLINYPIGENFPNRVTLLDDLAVNILEEAKHSLGQLKNFLIFK
jgi:hypothetical protein